MQQTPDITQKHIKSPSGTTKSELISQLAFLFLSTKTEFSPTATDTSDTLRFLLAHQLIINNFGSQNKAFTKINIIFA